MRPNRKYAIWILIVDETQNGLKCEYILLMMQHLVYLQYNKGKGKVVAVRN
jgi:hypothetical protein